MSLRSCGLTLFAFGLAFLSACQRPDENATQDNATKRFAGYARRANDAKLNGKDVEEAFYACFVEGRPYSEVADILKSAGKDVQRGETHYSWFFDCENNGHVDGFMLTVIIHDDTSTQKGKVVKTAYRTTLPS